MARMPSVAARPARHAEQRDAITSAASACIHTGIPCAWNAAAPNTTSRLGCVITTSLIGRRVTLPDGGDDRLALVKRDAAIDDDDPAGTDDERYVGNAAEIVGPNFAVSSLEEEHAGSDGHRRGRIDRPAGEPEEEACESRERAGG